MGREETVFVVDDDAAVAESLRELFESVELSVSTYPSAQAFIDAYDPCQPGCLVLDVRMPGMSGLQLQEYLNARNICVPVIFISGHSDVALAVRAVKGGAVDFLEKPFHEQDLLDRVNAALALDEGRRRLSVQHAGVLERLQKLSAREREVMNLIVEGKSSKTIANALKLSCKTVEFHRTNVLHKMGARTTSVLMHMVLTARHTAEAE